MRQMRRKERERERDQKGSYRTNIPYIDLMVLQLLSISLFLRARANLQERKKISQFLGHK